MINHSKYIWTKFNLWCNIRRKIIADGGINLSNMKTSSLCEPEVQTFRVLIVFKPVQGLHWCQGWLSSRFNNRGFVAEPVIYIIGFVHKSGERPQLARSSGGRQPLVVAGQTSRLLSQAFFERRTHFISLTESRHGTASTHGGLSIEASLDAAGPGRGQPLPHLMLGSRGGKSAGRVGAISTGGNTFLWMKGVVTKEWLVQKQRN